MIDLSKRYNFRRRKKIVKARRVGSISNKKYNVIVVDNNYLWYNKYSPSLISIEYSNKKSY